MIISLWSGPRNCSTALMYSLAQRADMVVRDEPLFGHYLAVSGANRPSRDETMLRWPTTARGALDRCMPSASNAESHLFLKHMANHVEGLPRDAFSDHRHVVLTRHPDAVLRSYGEHVEAPSMADLCYRYQLDWVAHCRREGWPVTVLESDGLLERPGEVLREWTGWLGLPWDDAMMQWEAGPRPEDGPWAKYWYEGVHRSRGWEKRQSSKAESFRPPERLRALREEAVEIFEELVSTGRE